MTRLIPFGFPGALVKQNNSDKLVRKMYVSTFICTDRGCSYINISITETVKHIHSSNSR